MAIKTVTSETVSLERLRELLTAAELLSNGEIDFILGEEYAEWMASIAFDLKKILQRREESLIK